MVNTRPITNQQLTTDSVIQPQPLTPNNLLPMKSQPLQAAPSRKLWWSRHEQQEKMEDSPVYLWAVLEKTETSTFSLYTNAKVERYPTKPGARRCGALEGQGPTKMPMETGENSEGSSKSWWVGMEGKAQNWWRTNLTVSHIQFDPASSQIGLGGKPEGFTMEVY